MADLIDVIDDVLSPELCTQLIARFEKKAPTSLKVKPAAVWI